MIGKYEVEGWEKLTVLNTILRNSKSCTSSRYSTAASKSRSTITKISSSTSSCIITSSGNVMIGTVSPGGIQYFLNERKTIMTLA
jgi:hypothetical protein